MNWRNQRKEEQEIEEATQQISKYMILFCFIPLIVVLLSVHFYEAKSISYNQKEYNRINKLEYSTIIPEKVETPRRYRYIKVRHKKYELPQNVFNKVNVGDSIIKKANCDSVVFYTIKGDTIFHDINVCYRENLSDLREE